MYLTVSCSSAGGPPSQTWCCCVMLQLAMHRERARIKKEAAIAAVKRLEMVKGVEGALDACGFGGPSSVCVGPGPGSGGSQPPVVRQSADKRPRKRQRAASDCMSDGEDEDEGDGEDEGEDDSEGEGEGEVKEDEGDVRRAGFHSLDPDMRVRFQLPRNYRPRVQGVGGSDGPQPAVFDSPVPQAVPPSVSSIQTEGKAQASSNAMLYHALHIIFGCCTVVTDDTGPSLSPPPLPGTFAARCVYFPWLGQGGCRQAVQGDEVGVQGQLYDGSAARTWAFAARTCLSSRAAAVDAAKASSSYQCSGRSLRDEHQCQ